MSNDWETATAAISMTRGPEDDIRLRVRTDAGLLIDVSWKLEQFSRSVMAEIAPCSIRIKGSKELEDTLRRARIDQ